MGLESYIWGYLQDQSGNSVKAVYPILVEHALAFDSIESLSCGYGGMFSLLGLKKSRTILQIYGKPQPDHGLPRSPFFKETSQVSEFYSVSPSFDLDLGDAGAVRDVALTRDLAFVLQSMIFSPTHNH